MKKIATLEERLAQRKEYENGLIERALKFTMNRNISYSNEQTIWTCQIKATTETELAETVIEANWPAGIWQNSLEKEDEQELDELEQDEEMEELNDGDDLNAVNDDLNNNDDFNDDMNDNDEIWYETDEEL